MSHRHAPLHAHFADASAHRRRRVWLALVVLLAAVLRFFPIWFGLPSLLARPDEETALSHAMAIVAGDPNPHFFHWPSLTFYLFALLFKSESVVKGVFAEAALTDVDQVLAARAMVALAGTLTIVALYWLGRQIVDATTGLLAALFLAVAILHVRESHFAMTDVLATLRVTLELALVVRALGVACDDVSPARGLRVPAAFALAGFAGGLSTSTKYSAAATLITIVAAGALLFGGAGRSLRSLASAAVHSNAASRATTTVERDGLTLSCCAFLIAFALGFLIATPYALLDFHTFAADLRYDMTHLSGGHGIDLGRGWSYHLLRSLPYGVGLPVFCAAVAGIVPLSMRDRRLAIAPGLFAVAFYASMGSGKAVFFRYVLPLVPVVCLSAAVAVREAASWLASRTHVPPAWTLSLVTLVVAGPGAVNSAWLDLLLARTDTRVVAGHWLSVRIKEGETLHESCGAYARLHMEHTSFHRWAFYPETMSFGDPSGRTPDWLVLCDSPLQYTPVPPELQRIAADKYVLVDVVTGAARKGGAVYDQQDAFFLPVSGFSTVERPGPTVFIYRRGDLGVGAARERPLPD